MASFGQHRCTPRCAHRCGESGGRTHTGTPCRKLGGWGIPKASPGHLLLCRHHDPQVTPPKTPPPKGLNHRQQLFVHEYCGRANGNAVKAAELSGYRGSYNTLAQTGHHLLKNTEIRRAIEEHFQAMAMPSVEVVKRMADDARLDVSNLLALTPTGQVALNLTPELLQQFGPLIKAIDVDPITGRIERLRFNDSQAARRDIARILKLFDEGTSVNVFLAAQQMSDSQLLAELQTTQQGLYPQAGRRGPGGNGPGGNGKPQPAAEVVVGGRKR